MDARKIELGDFQTPEALAEQVCARLVRLGLRPDVIIEPTCGVGAFVLAAARAFPDAGTILGFDQSAMYLEALQGKLEDESLRARVHLEQADFFLTDWRAKLAGQAGSWLVLGNLPWVTNSKVSVLSGTNVPAKHNFQRARGLDAITGKANFDISEWMLREIVGWMRGREGDVAMLVKSAVARKVLALAAREGVCWRDARLIGIDARRHFDVAVDACILVMRLSSRAAPVGNDYQVYQGLDDDVGRQVGHRRGLTVHDLDAFARHQALLGASPERWRSGIKHDAASVMELRRSERGLHNGLGEQVDLEDVYLFPLCKGSDIGSDKPADHRYLLVTQAAVGATTDDIAQRAPRTWAYLRQHASKLDARASSIYRRAPRFAIFGVGAYSFRPWRIAICSLYKALSFRLIGPRAGKPVMFDDTVYFVSFDDEQTARETLRKLQSSAAQALLGALIFWDEKRPIKASILNALDWSKLP